MEPRVFGLVFDIGGVLFDWNPRYLFRALFDGDPQPGSGWKPALRADNSSKEKFGILQKKYTFLEHFRGIMIFGEFGVINPHPRIFELFLERTGLGSEECIFIDDSWADVSSAIRMGWKAILFRSPDQLADELDMLGLKIASKAVQNAGPKELL